MSERTSSKPGIAGYVVARRKRKECFLDEIDRLIEWNLLWSVTIFKNVSPKFTGIRNLVQLSISGVKPFLSRTEMTFGLEIEV